MAKMNHALFLFDLLLNAKLSLFPGTAPCTTTSPRTTTKSSFAKVTSSTWWRSVTTVGSWGLPNGPASLALSQATTSQKHETYASLLGGRYTVVTHRLGRSFADTDSHFSHKVSSVWLESDSVRIKSRKPNIWFLRPNLWVTTVT